MSEPITYNLFKLADAAIVWEQARRATTDAPIKDARKDETFRQKLNRLANAEADLAAIARELAA